jgi:hypothetical protein
MRRWLALWTFFCVATPVYAVPITYQFVQTGASQPGLKIPASLTIDGTFADLPTISCPGCAPAAFHFQPLVAFTLDLPTGRTYTLADFIGAPIPLVVPQWWISPTEIRYFDRFDGFRIDLVAESISYSSDTYAPCFLAPCVVTGAFTAVPDSGPAPVPESSTILLVCTGLAAIHAARRKSSRRPVLPARNP